MHMQADWNSTCCPGIQHGRAPTAAVSCTSKHAVTAAAAGPAAHVAAGHKQVYIMTFNVLSQEADRRKSLLGLLAQQGAVLGQPAP